MVALAWLAGHGVGDVDAVVLAALLQLGVAALGGQHAHDLKAVGAHLDVLAYGVAVVGLPGQVVADDADILVLLDVHVLQAAAVGDGVVGHGGVVLVDAVDAGVAVGVPALLDGVAAGELDVGGDVPQVLGVVLHQAVHIVHRGVAGGLAPPDGHRHAVDAHGRKALPHRLGHAVAQAHDDDHRRDADDDAQHGEDGAHLVAPDVFQRKDKGIQQKHQPAPPSFARIF